MHRYSTTAIIFSHAQLNLHVDCINLMVFDIRPPISWVRHSLGQDLYRPKTVYKLRILQVPMFVAKCGRRKHSSAVKQRFRIHHYLTGYHAVRVRAPPAFSSMFTHLRFNTGLSSSERPVLTKRNLVGRSAITSAKLVHVLHVRRWT